jgi:hypothetical protein
MKASTPCKHLLLPGQTPREEFHSIPPPPSWWAIKTVGIAIGIAIAIDLRALSGDRNAKTDTDDDPDSDPEGEDS